MKELKTDFVSCSSTSSETYTQANLGAAFWGKELKKGASFLPVVWLLIRTQKWHQHLAWL